MTKNKRGLSRLSNRIEPSRKWTLDFVTAGRDSSGLSRSRDEREFITATLSQRKATQRIRVQTNRTPAQNR